MREFTFPEALHELGHMIVERYGIGPEVRKSLHFVVADVPQDVGPDGAVIVATMPGQEVTPENVLSVYFEGPPPERAKLSLVHGT